MFSLLNTSKRSRARRGELKTPHGVLQTPFFMPIATRGAVKTLSSFDVERLGSLIILSNAYHLWLRPGLEVLKSFGGLHAFMNWSGAILTDSGGFQIFSLEGLRELSEEGVTFQSHIDGAKMFLSPELCMDIQRVIGSDICMALDVCTRLPATDQELQEALRLTTAWAKRSKLRFEETREGSVNPEAQLFGIVQGGINLELREQSARELIEVGFDGYAIGGLSVGESFEDARRMLERLDQVLPQNQPRYFMGGAQPHEIVEYVKRGMDMFDCVLPTRNARHGQLYRWVHDDLSRSDFYEMIQVTNEKWKKSKEKLDIRHKTLDISLGYLRHLFTVDEMLAYRLATLVNVKFYLELMEKIRDTVEQGKL